MQYTIHLRGSSSAAQTYSKAGGSIRSDAEVYKKSGTCPVLFRTSPAMCVLLHLPDVSVVLLDRAVGGEITGL